MGFLVKPVANSNKYGISIIPTRDLLVLYVEIHQAPGIAIEVVFTENFLGAFIIYVLFPHF